MTGMDAQNGRSLSGLAYLRQSLTDILTTPIGSRVMRRDYGSEVPELIDQPLNSTTTLRIYAATAHAVMRWEPRLTLSAVQLEQNQAGQATLILDGVADEQNVKLTVLARP